METFDEALVKERVNAFPFVRMMGMRLLECRGGKSVMRCRVRKALKNSGGTLHGGVVGALVDMSVATALRSALPLTSRMTTVEYKVNLMKPVPDGTITARGSVIRLGKTIAVGTTEIRNEEGDPVAFGSATFYILNARPHGESPGIMVATTGRRKPGRKPVLEGES
ncbi:MAG: PaaI family thioesterase [Deltaproteobacteria bacterium]